MASAVAADPRSVPPPLAGRGYWAWTSLPDEDDASRNARAERFKRLLREQVYLLKNLSGSCILEYINYKLGLIISSHLRILVEKSIEECFARIHQHADRAKEMITEYVWTQRKPAFEAKKDADSVAIHNEMKQFEHLIVKGEKMLMLSNVDLLQSVEAYKLLEQLQEATERGNAKANEVISWFVNAAKSDVSGSDDVMRMLSRLYVAEPIANPPDNIIIQVPDPLQLARVDFGGAFRASADAAKDAFKKHTESQRYLDNIRFKTAVEELAEDLRTNFARVALISDALFKKYNSAEAFEEDHDIHFKMMDQERLLAIQEEAQEYIMLEFGVVAKIGYAHDELKRRLAISGGSRSKVRQDAFVTGWAFFVEGMIHSAMEKLVIALDKRAATNVKYANESGVYYVKD